MTKGQVIFGLVMGAAVGSTIYFGFVKKYSPSGLTWFEKVTSGGSELAGVKKRLGISTPGNVASVKFNNGTNTADFYDNNRVIIGKVGGAGFLQKGSYANSGLTITLDNGKVITSGSVWENLLNTIK